MNLRELLNERFSQAFEKATGEALSPQIQLSGKPEFGDYQANGAMAAAKALKQKPRDIAEQVVAAPRWTTWQRSSRSPDRASSMCI